MTLPRLLVGGLAGLTATVPMTLVMLALYRGLPKSEQYALPQVEIIDAVADQAGGHDDRDAASPPEPGKPLDTVAVLAHFGYGAASGAAYAALTPPGAARPALRGLAFGLALWAASYLGWLPLLGILTPATQHPPRRNAVMIAAHFIWGPVTALLVHRWTGGAEAA